MSRLNTAEQIAQTLSSYGIRSRTTDGSVQLDNNAIIEVDNNICNSFFVLMKRNFFIHYICFCRHSFKRNMNPYHCNVLAVKTFRQRVVVILDGLYEDGYEVGTLGLNARRPLSSG